MKKVYIHDYFQQKKWSWVLLIVVTLVVGVVAPMKSFILQWMIDAESKQEAVTYLMIGIGIIALTFLSESASRNIFSKLQCGAVEYFRNCCINTIMNRNIETYRNTSKSADLSTLTNDMKMLSEDFYNALYQVLLYGSMLLFALCMYIYINPSLLLFVAIAATAPIALPRLLDSRLKNNRLLFSQKSEAYVQSNTEILNGFEVLHDFQAQKGFAEQNRKVSRACAASEYNFLRVMNYSITLSSLLGNVLFFIVLLIGMLLVFDNKISIGYMVAATNLSNFIIAPCQVLSQNFARIKASKKIQEKIENLINEGKEASLSQNKSLPESKKAPLLQNKMLPERKKAPLSQNKMLSERKKQKRSEYETVQKGNYAPLSQIESVRLENISFRYDENQPLIENINFACSSREKIALIGQSGCGKSTLAKLIYGYIEQYKGTIAFNDIDMKKFNTRLLHQHIGYSSQSSYIFHDTIKNNICLYADYSDNEVNRVLEIVGLSKEIALLENGLETVIDENIKNLSGGQLQRIALARVLIRKYDMLILDEVTSSLDPDTTKKIMEYVLELPNIVIVITHDVFGSYMNRFDKVYTIEKGCSLA